MTKLNRGFGRLYRIDASGQREHITSGEMSAMRAAADRLNKENGRQCPHWFEAGK